MRLRLIRLDCDIPIDAVKVTTLEVEDRKVFTRIVRSLASGAGEYSEEPYLIIGEDGKTIAPKKALMLMTGLPSVPLTDRTLLTKLYKKVREQAEMDSTKYELVKELSGRLQTTLEESFSGLWGDYSLSIDWDVETYLKAFNLSPIVTRDDTLLDNCIRLFGLCADAGVNTPIAIVNAKSFFSPEELDELMEQAVFSGTQLILLETWADKDFYKQERKIVIDQHFISLG